MQFARSFFGKFFSFLCSIFGLQFLVACDDDSRIFKNEVTEEPAMYGMPPNWGYISGVVKGDTNNDGKTEPIPNVKFYCENKNLELSVQGTEDGLLGSTSANGEYFVDLWENGEYVFRFEDGDGEKNGSFKSQKKVISWNKGEKLANEDVTLERDDLESVSE